MPIDVRITVTGAELAGRNPAAMAERAADLRPAWLPVQEAFFPIMRRAFRTEGASTGGGAWTRLSIWTARGRASLGYPPFHPILQRTGALMRSLTQRGGEHLAVGTPSSLALGSDNAAFPFHHSRRARRKLPRRGFDLTPDDVRTLVAPIRRWVLDGSTAVGVRERAR